MAEIQISRKNDSYRRILIATPIALFFIIHAFINIYNSSNDWKLIILIPLGILCVLFTKFFVNAIIQIQKKAPALIINSIGLTDNISLFKAGLIKWENITSTEIKNFSGTPHLFIHLIDFTSIVSKQRGYKTQMIKTLIKDMGTPIAINLLLIDFDGNQLKSIIDNKRIS